MVAYGQSYTTKDSLIFLIKNSKEDTVKLSLYNSIIEEIFLDDPKEALEYAKEMTEFSEKIQSKSGIANGFAWMGYLEEQFGNV